MTGQIGDVIMGNLLDDSAQVASLLRHGHVVPALKAISGLEQSAADSDFMDSWEGFAVQYAALPVELTGITAGVSYVCESSQDSMGRKFRDR